MNYGSLGMNENGSAARVRIDTGTESVVTTADAHNALHRGQVYHYQIEKTASASTSGAWFFFQTGTSETHMSVVGLASNADNLKLYFYEYQGTSGSAGMSPSGFSASARAVNRNRTTAAFRAATGNVTILTGSGFSSACATQMDMHFIGGGTGVGGVKSGGTGPQEEEWPLKPSGQYAFYYANISACANTFNLRLTFRDYE